MTCMSQWFAFGTTAGQHAERIGNKASEASKESRAKGKNERAKSERDSVIGRMQRAGGSALVRATPGAGTEVTLRLPRRRP